MRWVFPAAVAGLAIAAFLAAPRRTGAEASPAKAQRILYYHDPMHPAYRSDKPGIAPDCGMRLVPVFAESGARAAAPRSLQIGSAARELMGIRSAAVERHVSTRTIRVPGRVAVDETRVYKIVPKVEGWIRQIFPVTTGAHVAKGQPLVSIYGRDYRMAQQSYIYALNALDKVQKDHAPAKDLADPAAQVDLQVAETLANLQNMWVDPAQIEEIARTRQAQFETRLTSPADGFVVSRNVFINEKFDAGTELFRVADLGRVWIVADVFAGDLHYIPAGGSVRVALAADPKTALTARASDVPPEFDGVTLTARLRLEAGNPRFALRPGMIVDVDLPVKLPESLTVPVDAVIDAGIKQTVYVDRGDGTYEPRTVRTGWRFDDEVEILEGLAPGERVVGSATFLLDSESRLMKPNE